METDFVSFFFFFFPYSLPRQINILRMQTYAFTGWNYFQGHTMQKKSFKKKIIHNKGESHYLRKV